MSQPNIETAVGIYGGAVLFALMSMAQPFFTLLAQSLGATTMEIGLLVTLRAVLPILIAMPIGQWIDRVGALRMLLFGVICLAVSLALTCWSDGLFLLAVSQLLLGVSMVICASSLQVLVSYGERAERDAAIQKFSIWMSLGGMAGPLIGGFIVSLAGNSLSGYRTLFFYAAASALLFFIILLSIRRVVPATEQHGMFSIRALRDSYTDGWQLAKLPAVQFGLLATFFIMFIQAIYMSFMPVYLDQLGYVAWQISLVIAMKEFAALSLRFTLPALQRKVDLRTVILWAAAISAFCVLATPWMGIHFVLALVIVAVLGGAVGVNLPVSIMIMVNETGADVRGKLMSLRLLMNRFAQLSSPALFGLLGQFGGLTFAFYSGGIVLFCSLLGFTAYTHSARLQRFYEHLTRH